MAQNPYQAPEAQVSVPAVPNLPRPPEVTRAAWILWISLAVSVLTLLPAIRGQWWAPEGSDKLPYAGAIMVGWALLMFAVSAWLVWMTSQGRNWARWSLLALFVVGWLFLLTDFSRSITETPFAALADAVIAIVEVWACLLLFRGPGAAWFAPRK